MTEQEEAERINREDDIKEDLRLWERIRKQEHTQEERHQFLAGAQRVIIATDKSLKHVAEAQQKKK